MLSDLLQKGYLPQELPPPFNSITYAQSFKNANSIPSCFNKPPKAQLAIHNLARAGKLRRRLSIPNPAHHYTLSALIEKHWKAIESHCKQSVISKSLPVLKPGSRRAIVREFDFDNLPSFRARTRSTSRYVLISDIANYFSSFYTHSIPWALHSKAVAKANQSNALFGNALDQVIRDGQDKQTGGIPISPDTSFVISEILLTALDHDLGTKMPLKGFRYMDDFELGFDSLSHAEEALGALQSTAYFYDLQLNQGKTSIQALPDTIERPWISELRRINLQRKPVISEGDVVGYFNTAFKLASDYENEAILKYSISRFPLVNQHNWSIVQELMLQVALVESGTLSTVIGQFLRHLKAGHNIDRESISNTIRQIISTHAPLGHGSEVAWAIWGSICFSLTIDDSTAELLSQMDDSIVSLLALDAKSRKLISNNVDFAKWAGLMSGDQLWTDQWLLAYEANIKGWLPPLAQTDYVSADPCFAYLKLNNVSFYDPNTAIAEHLLTLTNTAKALKRQSKEINPFEVDNEEDEDVEDNSEKERYLNSEVTEYGI